MKMSVHLQILICINSTSTPNDFNIKGHLTFQGVFDACDSPYEPSEKIYNHSTDKRTVSYSHIHMLDVSTGIDGEGTLYHTFHTCACFHSPNEMLNGLDLSSALLQQNKETVIISVKHNIQNFVSKVFNFMVVNKSFI